MKTICKNIFNIWNFCVIFENMSSRSKFPTCIICGRPGIPIGVISGKEVVVCTNCAEPLYNQLGSLIAAMRGARPRLRRRPRISPEEFKEMVIKTVEERGSAQLFEYCRRYGISRKDARKLADELVAEKGWVKEEAKGKLYIKKQEAAT